MILTDSNDDRIYIFNGGKFKVQESSIKVQDLTIFMQGLPVQQLSLKYKDSIKSLSSGFVSID